MVRRVKIPRTDITGRNIKARRGANLPATGIVIAGARATVPAMRTRRRQREAQDQQMPGPSSPKRQRGGISADDSMPGPSSGPARSRIITRGQHRTGGKRKRVQTTQERLENDVNELLCSFGDCDPEHIRTKLSILSGEPRRYELVYQDLLAGDYPKFRERLQREHMEQMTAQMNGDPSIEQLITWYSDADARQRVLRERKVEDKASTYKLHALCFLANHCLYLPELHIRKVINRHNDVISAHKQLLAENQHRQQHPRASGRRGTYLRNPRKRPLQEPEESCLEFSWDKLYIQKQDDILEHQERLEASRTLRFMEAKSRGYLQECPVCLETMLPEELLPCLAGHGFCRSCIHLSAKEQLGMGQSSFTCLLLDCDCQFDLYVLQQALMPSLYQKVEGRVQLEEVRRAGLEGLAPCPSCSYAVVFPDDARGTVLQCENPHCLATTCRFCKGDAHPPFTCEQRNSAKIKLKQHIENSMTDAITRTCSACDRRFIKGGGCNRMTCPNCGASMCYVCGDKLENGYQHFAQNPRCSVIDEALVHEADLNEAVPKAEKEFREKNREARDITLDFDPIEDWKSAPKPAPIPNPMAMAW